MYQSQILSLKLRKPQKSQNFWKQKIFLQMWENLESNLCEIVIHNWCIEVEKSNLWKKKRAKMCKNVQKRAKTCKNVHLKYFWTQFKNVHLRGPCSLRPCISRPYSMYQSQILSLKLRKPQKSLQTKNIFANVGKFGVKSPFVKLWFITDI
jgi:hypothetical protein